MHSEGAIVIGIFLFIFILWAYTGGPSRPISVAGPYITPITNLGQTQVGYGPKLQIGGSISLPAATLGATGRTQTIQNTSSFSGTVTLVHLTGDKNVPTGYARITVSSTAGKDVDLTGWKLVSVKNGTSGTIPTGILVMKLGASNTLQEIILRPGDKAVVAPTTSPVNASFEANQCSGYLLTQQSLYNACVNQHANAAEFLVGTWYVYLGKNGAIWNENGDTIELIDNSGKVVDSYTY
ncbi:MAG: lamin tail domain-containing protein [Candidatus Pacebacteria bacterium]|nr:lamin tail domain-containing protein [Candidatus Paceibacterota bacterium]